MTGDVVVTAVAAVGASGVTVGGMFGLDAWRSRRDRKANLVRAVAAACESMIGRALRLAIKAGTIHEVMISRSGLPESLEILLRRRKPIDMVELADWYLEDMGPLLDAQSTVWLIGSPELIAGASDVIRASRRLTECATALAESQQPESSESGRAMGSVREVSRRLRPIRKDPEMEVALQRAGIELGRSCRRFGQTMRVELEVPEVTALLDAFPQDRDDTTLSGEQRLGVPQSDSSTD